MFFIDMSCINYAKLKKQCDIQAIAFDKDNCLTAPYVSTIHSPFNVCRGNKILSVEKNQVLCNCPFI